MKRYFDAIVIVPLNEEFEQVIELFKIEENISTEKNIMFAVNPPESPIKVLLVQQAGMGKGACVDAVENCLRDFDCGILVCVGIAGSLSADVTIGDVCYSGTILDVTENAKVTRKGARSQKILLSSKAYSSPSALTIPITVDRIDPTTKAAHLEWADTLFSEGQKLIPGEFQGLNGRESLTLPIARESVIACGLVSASPEYNDAVRGVDRKVSAIETESGGLFAVADRFGIPALTVRGISDYAGVDKSKFERDTNNNARKFAIMTAASFLARHLASRTIGRYLHARVDDVARLPLEPPSSHDSAAMTLISQDTEIGERLRELAPAHPLISQGYRLPVPRIRLRDPRSAVSGTKQGAPIEVREALRGARVITIHVPREYPDLSLSWVIAKDLLSAQVDERQIVPVVIEADYFKPPRGALSELTAASLLLLGKSNGYIHVFIIDDFKFNSKSRSDFLKDQVDLWPDAKFLVVTRNNEDVYLQAPFAQRVAASSATLCDVSFSELATFMKSAFAMEASASEVVASKLRDIFKRYALEAHPSYFAGIPPSTLNTLLQANRRAELIEIAVMGYLSFVVADDKSDVQLSRRTRERFLGEVVLKINVEGIDFSEPSLIEFAQAFAKQYDYDISPTRFIAAFFEKRILHVEGERIRFTLPFIESYLLARRLNESDSSADVYFDLRSERFDFRTFALYAELGASKTIVNKINDTLGDAINSLKPSMEETPSLFNAELDLPFLSHPERFVAVQKRLERAEDDVRSDRDQTKEKQRLLDASDQITEDLASRSQLRADDAAQGRPRIPNVPLHAEQAWAVAVNLLGSGAERLEADKKRELVKKVVKLTGIIMERWMRAHLVLDMPRVKTEILANKDLISHLAGSAEPAEVQRATQLISSIVDLLEFIFILQPFMGTTTYLCEEARDVVLAESIGKTEADDLLGELLRNLWLADIDVARGKAPLVLAIKRLPRVKILRHSIAIHLMGRVFWRHWRKEDRLSLLDIADESLKGIGLKKKTGQLVRMLEDLD